MASKHPYRRGNLHQLDKVKVDENGCWIWQGSTSSGGRYGKVQYEGRTVGAHVAVYTDIYGPVPEGMVVMHDCMSDGAPRDNGLCVRYDHLTLGTQKDNMQDYWRKREGA